METKQKNLFKNYLDYFTDFLGHLYIKTITKLSGN